ncbi:TPA: hypothetical protein UM674_000616 [Stenotrophomonas maltophilia]|nr:hypothetical protein [Stenotrophomonas maltophilia]
MNDIEKRAQIVKILQGHTTEMEGYSYFSSNPGIPEDRYEEIADEIIAALMLGGPVDLLDQGSAGGVQPQELDVVPPSALGADEAGAVGIDQVAGGLPRNVQLAEVASEHKAGVRPEGDGQATADHVAHDLKMVERARALLARLERAKRNQRGHWCDARAAVDAACDLLPAIIAALTPPEGWVLMPRVLTEEMLQAGYPADDAQFGYEAMIAARPEVRRG